MPPADALGVRSVIARNRGLILPILIVASILVIIAPLPPGLMDLLIAANVTLSVVILLSVIHVQRPLDFSVFPSVLLGTTLARLVLNVASTRLILAHGHEGTSAAGAVIDAFGHFVAGGDLVVGLVIFAILIVIQFLVITRGSARISEVAARFALDGLPGKQMAIDADLNAGLLTRESAGVRREQLAQEADFYGAMDGASKFVRGDAIAGVLITSINILGGLYVGMFEHGMRLGDAVRVFTTLTIGDGLVTQLPAFLIALAAGLLVTRSSTRSDLSSDMMSQLLAHPTALFLSGGLLLALATTGLPMLPLVLLGAGCVILGLQRHRSIQASPAGASGAPSSAPDRRIGTATGAEATASEVSRAASPGAVADRQPSAEEQLRIDPLEIVLGIGLLGLADPSRGGDLLERINRVRHKIARELGFILPKVRVRDDLRLGQREYEIRLRGVTLATGVAYPDALLAIVTGHRPSGQTLHGIETREPAFGREALWIEARDRGRAEQLGFQVTTPAAVVVTHLTELVRQHGSEILTRQQVHQLLDHLRTTSPRLIEELIPDLLKTAEIHQVLAGLLSERIPIRDLETILEVLGNTVPHTRNPIQLVEAVRQGLARTICDQYCSGNLLHAVTLDPLLEDQLANACSWNSSGLSCTLAPQLLESLSGNLTREIQRLQNAGHRPIVLCSAQTRAALRMLTRGTHPTVSILSLSELTNDVQIVAHGMVPASGTPTGATQASEDPAALFAHSALDTPPLTSNSSTAASLQTTR